MIFTFWKLNHAHKIITQKRRHTYLDICFHILAIVCVQHKKQSAKCTAHYTELFYILFWIFILDICFHILAIVCVQHKKQSAKCTAHYTELFYILFILYLAWSCKGAYLILFQLYLRWGLVVLDSEVFIWTCSFFHRSQIQHSCWSRNCLISFPDCALYLLSRRFQKSASLFLIHLSFLLVYVLVESGGIIYACCWLLLIMGTQHSTDIWEHLCWDRTFPTFLGNRESVW